LKSKGTEVGREGIWIAKSGREEIKQEEEEERYRKTERNYMHFQRRLGLKNVVIPSTSNA
jgi:HSP20 family molecular chaperone IbpA